MKKEGRKGKHEENDERRKEENEGGNKEGIKEDKLLKLKKE
jgi:hypothetical protein